jgi:alkylation response protein AidB-like acyl-CoA dehydrogenase
MAWDFSTDPVFQEKLAWVDDFVRTELEPLEVIFPDQEFLPLDTTRKKIVKPLQDEVRKRDLWAPHLSKELGGQGFSAVDLCLLNEILGRSTWASIVFGTMAPDTGNAEILEKFGTAQQKETYLQPLLDGEIRSCFSVTEPQGGGDPKVFTTTAVRDGDGWVINGRKYFSSNADIAEFLIVMAVTNPEVKVHHGASLFVVPRGTEGITFEGNHPLFGAEPWGAHHGLLRYENVRVPADAILGEENKGFEVMQTRMAGGRLHMSMRAIGLCQRMIEIMGERAQSRFTQGSKLIDKLMVLHASWVVDTQGGEAARREIGAVKARMPYITRDIAQRTIQVLGALGTTEMMPVMRWLMSTMVFSLADGPTEVHKVNLGRSLFRDFSPYEGDWPTEFYENRLARAKAKHAGTIEQIPYTPTPVVPNWQAAQEW